MTLTRSAFRHSENYYLAVLTELAAPAMAAAARLRCGSPYPAASWRKGLIISHTHIGDALYRTSSLHALAHGLPNCQWYYLCSGESAPVLRRNASLAGVLPLVTGEDSWTLERGGFKTLRNHEFDVALCTNTLRHYPDIALSIALGVPNRVGYDHKGLSGLITTAIDLQYPRPFPAYFRTMVANVTGTIGDWTLRPRLALTDSDIELADRVMAELQLDGTPVLLCCPATRQPVGAWPPGQMLIAAEDAARRMRARLVLGGGPADRELLESLAARASARCDVIAGTLPITAFAAFISKCAIVLAQDSAPRHLANAMETPVVFMSNLSVRRVETGKYCETELDAAPPNEFVTDATFDAVVTKCPPPVIADYLVTMMETVVS